MVEKYAKKFGCYKGNGTNPLAIKRIFDAAAKELKVSIYPTSSGYLKNVGYNFNKIMNLIDNKIPVVISINNDGRNYYRNHSMTIMGYTNYRITQKTGKIVNRSFLNVYDNWRFIFGYIDYKVLS